MLKNAKNTFCACSGKPIRNKEVILTIYAKEYVEKMGYKIEKYDEEKVKKWLRDQGYLITNFKIK